MPQTSPSEWFFFSSDACPDAGFHVVRFKGSEGINQLFEFHITLVSTNPDIEIDRLLAGKACFTVARENAAPVKFNGMLSRARQGALFHGWTFYDVVLRPSSWMATQYRFSGVMVNQTLQEYLEWVYQSEEFRLYPHEFHFSQEYAPKEFSMMYGETFADYIQWLLEEQGAYCYLAENEDKLIYADSPSSHQASRGKVVYSPRTGLDSSHRDEVVVEFSCSCTHLPHEVVVRSYSWKDPNKVLVGKAVVSPTGVGYLYLPNEGAETKPEIDRIARLRAEQIRCESCRYTGRGSVPWMRPGVVFTLCSHYKPSFNTDYLITDITHEGGQETLLSLLLNLPLTTVDAHTFYHNTFSCIPADVPYRPARKAKRAKISGVIRAFIDSNGGDPARAEMDRYGRYKLFFPFDLNAGGPGKASAWVRQAKEQVGKDSGVSFPLLPGTEVLVSFIDGDPDRPVISGALPNGETGSVTRSNATGISTAGGNRLVFNDTNTKQGIGLQTASGSGILMAADTMDTTVSSSDVVQSIANMSLTSIANLSSSSIAGWMTQKATVSSVAKHQIIINILSSISSLSAGICDYINKNTCTNPNTGLSVATSTLKTLSNMIPLVSLYFYHKKFQPLYSNLKISNEEMIFDQQIAKPNIKSLLTASLIAFQAKIGSTGINTKNKIQAYEKTDQDQLKKDKKNQNETYYKTKKEKMVADIVTTSINTIIPEIVASLAIPTLQAKKVVEQRGLGGILSASDRNININSGTCISAHAKKCIYMSTAKKVVGLQLFPTSIIGINPDEIDTTMNKITKNRDSKNVIDDFDDSGYILMHTRMYYTVCEKYLANVLDAYEVKAKSFNIFCYENKNIKSSFKIEQGSTVLESEKLHIDIRDKDGNQHTCMEVDPNNLCIHVGEETSLKETKESVAFNSKKIAIDASDTISMKNNNGAFTLSGSEMNLDIDKVVLAKAITVTNRSQINSGSPLDLKGAIKIL